MKHLRWIFFLALSFISQKFRTAISAILFLISILSSHYYLAMSINHKFNTRVHLCSWIHIMLNLTSHGILHYLWSADLLKIPFQLIVSLFTFFNQLLVIIFSRYFSIDLKVRGYPTLLISWFINFNQSLFTCSNPSQLLVISLVKNPK